MNLFILDTEFEQNAQYHCDSHVVKLPLEAAQLLCTVRHLTQDEAVIPYRPTHKHHPLTKWVAASTSNYWWTVAYGIALCKEYTFRYGKTHACEAVIRDCGANLPQLPVIGLTEHVLVMPEQYKTDDLVESYRQYYLGEKRKLFKWTKRPQPPWLI